MMKYFSNTVSNFSALQKAPSHKGVNCQKFGILLGHLQFPIKYVTLQYIGLINYVLKLKLFEINSCIQMRG